MSEEESQSIQVNFGRAMPVFPLEQVALLPQQQAPIHVFEPRYRQMVEHALDGAGQIAMAIYERNVPRSHYAGRPPLRPAVCISQIARHEKLEDGRYNLLLQGICRARILHELPPAEGRLYRTAMLEPVGLDGAVIATSAEDAELELEEHRSETEPETLRDARARIGDLLAEGPLALHSASQPLLEYVRNDEVPTLALLELLSFTIVAEPRLRYLLLAEGKSERRARLILAELDHLTKLIRRAVDQHPEEWPKGCSWN